MSEFRRITGTVQLHEVKTGKITVVGLQMFGAMPFLFVDVRGHMNHLLPDGVIGNTKAFTWAHIYVTEAYRLEPNYSVVSAIDIARETAKRLGVEQ